MNRDSIKLLRECNAGIKMGTSAMAKVIPHVKDAGLKSGLSACRDTHNDLGIRTKRLLKEAHEDTKSVHPIAQLMSEIKVSASVMMGGADKRIAHVMTDGCDMGIKSLTSYLNQYKNADRKSRAIAEELIASEEMLEVTMRSYL